MLLGGMYEILLINFQDFFMFIVDCRFLCRELFKRYYVTGLSEGFEKDCK